MTYDIDTPPYSLCLLSSHHIINCLKNENKLPQNKTNYSLNLKVSTVGPQKAAVLLPPVSIAGIYNLKSKI